MLPILLFHASCMPLSPDFFNATALTAADDVCQLLGGTVACLNLCMSLRSDACWNEYLGSLAPSIAGGSLTIWLALQTLQSTVCSVANDAARPRVSSCDDWELLEPLTPHALVDALCDMRCDWESDLPVEAQSFVLGSTAAVGIGLGAEGYPPALPPMPAPPPPPSFSVLFELLGNGWCRNETNGQCNDRVPVPCYSRVSLDRDRCTETCRTDATCRGIEFVDPSRCELWTSTPAQALVPSGGWEPRCYAKRYATPPEPPAQPSPPMPPPQVGRALTNSTKRLFCARRFSGEYCQRAHEPAERFEEPGGAPSPSVCLSLASGCADYLRAHILRPCDGQRAAACVAEFERLVAMCEEQATSDASSRITGAPRRVLPPDVLTESKGEVPLREV